MTHGLAFRGRCFLSSHTSVVSLLCFPKASSQLSFLLLFPLVDDKVQNFSSLPRQSCVIFHLLPLNSFHPLLRWVHTEPGEESLQNPSTGKRRDLHSWRHWSICEPEEHTRQLKATHMLGPGQHFFIPFISFLSHCIITFTFSKILGCFSKPSFTSLATPLLMNVFGGVFLLSSFLFFYEVALLVNYHLRDAS